jgi:lipopolysaccharide/colanic/teichoic acid biosynthesis glycosyltransferase
MEMKPEVEVVVLPSAAPPNCALPVWKRALDIVCIIVALPLLAPLMALIAVFIKCVSRGPVLFRQTRVGYEGQQFLCIKFRTMDVSADEDKHAAYCKQLIQDQGRMTKLDHLGDSRLILGAPFLRATGLDELPQLYNVLRGEMSLVGPRPCTPYEYDNYLPWHKSRFQSVPGLTGLWQVSGKNDTTFNEMIQLDIDYAARRSFWVDVCILLKTVLVVAAQVREVARRKLSRLLGR